MSKSEKSSKPSMLSPVKRRRARVLKKLELQLKSGIKKSKDGKSNLPLEERDLKRIKLEINTLVTRV